MTKRKRFFINGLLMTAVGLALRTVTLVFAAYVSRTVGSEGVGLNTLISTVYAFAFTLATSGVSLTVTKLIATHIGEGEDAKIADTVKAGMIYSLIFSGAATALLASLSGVLATYVLRDTRVILPFQILSLSLIPEALSGVISGYFVGVRRVLNNAAVSIFSQLLRIVVTVILLSGAHGDVAVSVAYLCVGITVTSFISFILALLIFFFDRRGRGYRKSSAGELASVFGFALPLAFSAYIRSALLSVEHALIPRRLTDRGESPGEALSSFGTLHGMSLPIITYPMSPLSSFASLLLPEFAESLAAGDSERLSRIASEAFAKTLKYAVAVASLLFVFSEDIGYTVYGSHAAGYYVAMLAPVVPIMYLDHVTDAMLKGIGEQVYSMWVNIADSFLSVILVWVLIPIFGISGYALVIICMELFNFTLSFIRLRRRIRLRVNLITSAVLPLLCALLSGWLVSRLFIFAGSATTPVSFIMKLVFAISAYLAADIPSLAFSRFLISLINKHRNRRHSRKAQNKSK